MGCNSMFCSNGVWPGLDNGPRIAWALDCDGRVDLTSAMLIIEAMEIKKLVK